MCVSMILSDDDSADQRIEDDATVVAAVFQELKVENVNVESIVRLEKRAANPVQNPRPMKVVLHSVNSKFSLLRKSKNFRKNRMASGSISYIFTPSMLLWTLQLSPICLPRHWLALKPLLIPSRSSDETCDELRHHL